MFKVWKYQVSPDLELLTSQLSVSVNIINLGPIEGKYEETSQPHLLLPPRGGLRGGVIVVKKRKAVTRQPGAVA